MNIRDKIETGDPMTDTAQRIKAIAKDLKPIIKEAIREVDEERRGTKRNIAQAVWHGVTVAQAEIWKAMGWK